MDVNAFTVAAAALVTALACGLGALPFAFGADAMRGRLGIADAAAAGAMLAATVVLVYEGWGRGSPRLLAGVVLGVAFIALTAAHPGRAREACTSAGSAARTPAPR